MFYKRATRKHLRGIRKEFGPKSELIMVMKGNTGEVEDQLCFHHIPSAPSDPLSSWRVEACSNKDWSGLIRWEGKRLSKGKARRKTRRARRAMSECFYSPRLTYSLRSVFTVIFPPGCDFTRGRLPTHNSMSLATTVFKGLSHCFSPSLEWLSHVNVGNIPFLVLSSQKRSKKIILGQ